MIYALIDKKSLNDRNIDLSSLLEAINTQDIPLLQYRNKNNSKDEIKSDLELIRAEYRGEIIINDYLEFIDLADGLHLGQEDLFAINVDPQKACKEVRNIIGKKIFGLSTHDKNEIEIANTLDVDYVGLGAYRSTGTKSDARVYGEKLLEIARYSKHPLALIGGIKLSDRFDERITYRVIGSDLFALL